MDKRELMYRASLISLVMMVVILFFLDVSEVDKPNIFFQALGGLLSLSFVLPATYIWLDGFTRFKPTIGFYSGKWVAYVAFNLFAGLYLHHAYKKHS